MFNINPTIIRRVDEIGRVVIPRKIRCALEIKEGDTLEIWRDKDSIILRKIILDEEDE